MILYLGKEYGVKNLLISKKTHRSHKKYRLFGLFSSLIAKRHIAKALKHINRDDIIISHDSHIFEGANRHIIQNLKCKKILLLRNPATPEFVRRATSLFDKIYTFERDKAPTLGAEYLPQFIPVGYEEAKSYRSLKFAARRPRCFFLGRDKGRSKSLAKLAHILENAGCEIDFSIVRDRTSKEHLPYHIEQELDYSYSFLKALMSDVIVDIVQKGQTGWTLRILEAIYLNKKIISNNPELLNSEFYSEDRIFIIGVRDWSEISSFLAQGTPPFDSDFLYQYSPDSMLNSIKQAVGHES